MKFKNKEIKDLSKKDIAEGLNDDGWNKYFYLMFHESSGTTREEKMHLANISDTYESEIKNEN